MEGKSKRNKCCTAGGNKWKKQTKHVDCQSNYIKQMKYVLLKSKWNQTVRFTFEVNSSTCLRIINLFLHVGLHWIRYLVKLLFFFFIKSKAKIGCSEQQSNVFKFIFGYGHHLFLFFRWFGCRTWRLIFLLLSISQFTWFSSQISIISLTFSNYVVTFL